MTAPNSNFKSVLASPESFMDFFTLYSKQAAITGVAIVLLGAGGWFYIQSQNLKQERAEKAYFAAQRSLNAGNLPLAESDLKKMVERYDGTTSAKEARLQVAQILYDQGKYQEGVDYLKPAEDKIGKSKEFGSSVHMVLAGGLEQLKKFKEAAAEYEKAAEASRFDSDRERAMSLAARAYLSGADTAKAKSIWTTLGADSKGTVAGEARVRLGELTSKAEPQS